MKKKATFSLTTEALEYLKTIAAATGTSSSLQIELLIRAEKKAQEREERERRQERMSATA